MSLLEKILRKIVNSRSLDKRTRKLLFEKFNVYGYWYPLHYDIKQDHVEYFQTNVFEEKYGLEKTVKLITSLGDKIVNEINEVGSDKKITLDNFDLGVDETFYCNDNVDWLIYCSHENTTTIAGKTLLDKLKTDWKEWDKYKDPWRLQDSDSGSA